MAMARHALADHSTIQDIERGKQRGRAVPDIIVDHRSGPTLLHRQSWLRAIERLNLRLLVDRYAPADRDPAGSFRLFLGTGGTSSKLGCGNGMQEGAHLGSALRAERLLELPLRLHPSFHPRPKPGFSSLGQAQLLAPAVTATLLDGDQAFTLQRQDVPAEGGAVHHHLSSKGVDRHRTQSPQRSEN